MKTEYIKTLKAMEKKINEGRMFFIKGNQTSAFSKEEIEDIIQNKDIEMYYYRYGTDKMQSIFCPLLGWIKDIYERLYSEFMTEEDFINECGIYSLHKECFISYLKTGCVLRAELVVLGEIQYEQEMFVNSVIRILKYILKFNKLILVFDGLQNSNSSIIEIFKALIEGGQIANLSILVYYNDNYDVLEYMQNDWNKLLQLLNRKDMIIDYSNIINDEQEIIKGEVISREFELKAEDIEDTICKINNMIVMTNVNQALYYSQILYDNISNKTIEVDREYQKKSIVYLIMANIYLKYRTNLMVIHKMDYYIEKFLCEELKKLSSGEDDIVNYIYAFFKCMIYNIENQPKQAFAYYMQCKEFSSIYGDEKYDFYADLNYYIMLCYDKTILTRRKEKISQAEIELAKELEKREQYNLLAYMYLYNFEISDEEIEAISTGKKDFEYLYKAVEYGKKINNRFFLELVYGRKNIYFNNNNINDKLFKLDVGMQEYLGLALANQKYSFMAYRYTMTEEYGMSHKTNNELLLKMYDSLLVEGVVENYSTDNNIVEFLLAVYNMSVNCMCARDYKAASQYLNIAIKEMEMLNSFDLSMCDLSKLYGMLAYCYMEMEMDYKCALNLYKLRNIIEFGFKYEQEVIEGSCKVRRDSLFLLYITEGLVSLKDGDFQTAEKKINRAYEFFKVEEGQWPFMYPIMAKASYMLYMNMGMEDKAKDIIIKCREFAKEYKLFDLAERMDYILEGKEIVKKRYDFSLKGITKEKMFALLKKKRMEMELDLKSKEFEFISLWNNNVNRREDEVECIKSSIEMAGNFLKLENMLYITLSKEKDIEKYNEFNLTRDGRVINVEYNSVSKKLSDIDIFNIVDYFNSKENKSFLVTRINSKFIHYSELIEIFEEEDMICFMAIPVIKEEKIQSIFIAYGVIGEAGISNDDLIKNSKLDTLKILFNQLVDIEKIHKSDKQLKEALYEANAANKAKSDFLANMSHEIRTPLNSVLGMGEMILREAKDDEIIEYATNIKNSGTALLSIINDILDFSKIESGKMEIVPVEYEFSSLLYDIYNMFSPRADKKGLKFSINVAKDMPYRVIGDDVRIRQILTNIITNGIKYTKEGSVTLNIDWSKARKDSIFVKVSVVDTGVGIKKEDIGKLFETFQRLDIEKNRNIEGTGLGMGITVKLLNMMGSKLDVESEYGKGSTFSFTIEQTVVDYTPMGDFKVQAENTIKKLNTLDKQKKVYTTPDANILVVDDNDMNRLVIKKLLKETKAHVTTLESGIACLEEVKKKHYDIIFLDHMMPEMDGIQTLHALENQEENMCKQSPIIVLTANAISGAREMYLKEGFVDYLSKPINSDKLEKMIVDYLPKELVKVETVDVKEEAEKEENQKEETDNEWEYVTGLDMHEAKQYNPDRESFDQLLKMYYDTIESKAKQIEEYEQSEQIKEYTIQVHALKSSSRIIGATVISELAARLEAAGNAEDLNKIHKDTPLLLALYRKYREFLEPFVPKEEEAEKVEASNEEIIVKLSLLKSAMEEFDLNSADDIMKEIQEIKIPDVLQEDFETLQEYITNFNVEETPKLIDEMIEKLG